MVSGAVSDKTAKSLYTFVKGRTKREKDIAKSDVDIPNKLDQVSKISCGRGSAFNVLRIS